MITVLRIETSLEKRVKKRIAGKSWELKIKGKTGFKSI
jgi:hypothetical protein